MRRLTIAEKAQLVANRTLDLMRKGLSAKDIKSTMDKEYGDGFILEEWIIIKEKELNQ